MSHGRIARTNLRSKRPPNTQDNDSDWKTDIELSRQDHSVVLTRSVTVGRWLLGLVWRVIPVGRRRIMLWLLLRGVLLVLLLGLLLLITIRVLIRRSHFGGCS